MDLAHVDELAKDNNSVKYLLVRQDLFDKNADAEKMESKDFDGKICGFLTMITNIKSPKKLGWWRKWNCWRVSKKSCTAEGVQLFSTMSESKAVIAVGTKRALKSFPYRYVDYYRCKYLQFVQFVPEFTGSFFESLKFKDCQKFELFDKCLQKIAMAKKKTPNSKWKQSSYVRVRFSPQESLKNTVYTRSYCKCGSFTQKTAFKHNK